MGYTPKLQNISVFLQKVSDLPTAQERVDKLKENDLPAIRTVLKYMFDPKIKFILPKSDPPYEESKFDDHAAMYRESRRLYLFVDGGHPDLTDRRRQELFIGLLEMLAPSDAKLLLNMKNAVNPYDGLTVGVVNKAFPGLI